MVSSPAAIQSGEAPASNPSTAFVAGGESARITRHAFLNNLALLISGVIGLLLVPFLLHRLGAVGYGLWAAVCSTAAVVGTLDLGIGYTLARDVAVARSDRSETSDFAAAAPAVFLVLGVAGGLVLAVAAWPFSSGLARSGIDPQLVRTLFALAGLALVADRLSGYGNAVLVGMRRFEVLNGLVLAVSLLRTAGAVAALVGGFGLIGLAVSNVAASVLGAGLYLLLTVTLAPAFRFRLRPFSLAELRSRIPFGIGSQIVTLTSALLWELPAALIGAFRGAAAVVPYYVGQRFPVAALRFSAHAAEVVFPAAGEHQANAAKTREVLEAATRWMLFVSLPFATILLVQAPDLLLAWLGRADPDAVLVLRLTTMAVLTNALGAGSLHLIWGRGQLRSIVPLLVAMNGGFVVASVFGLRLIGPSAPAWALLMTAALGNATLLFEAARTCGATTLGIVRRASSGLILPAALAASVSVIWKWRPPLEGRIGVILAAAAAALAYAFSVLWYELRNSDSSPVGAWYPHLRERLSRFQRLRSAWYFGECLLEALSDSSRSSRAELERDFRAGPDPYRLHEPAQLARFGHSLGLLDRAGGKAGRALEVGCAEGHFTRLLAPRCQSLLAVDFCPQALERAHERCGSRVQFAEWDLRRDPSPGEFDLVVVLSVLEYFRSRRAVHRARTTLVEALVPGGYLLIGNVRAPEWMERSWWATHLLRGGQAIDEFFGEHSGLERIDSCREDGYIQSLFQKKPACAGRN